MTPRKTVKWRGTMWSRHDDDGEIRIQSDGTPILWTHKVNSMYRPVLVTITEIKKRKAKR